jgi:hypothetical protein
VTSEVLAQGWSPHLTPRMWQWVACSGLSPYRGGDDRWVWSIGWITKRKPKYKLLTQNFPWAGDRLIGMSFVLRDLRFPLRCCWRFRSSGVLPVPPVARRNIPGNSNLESIYFFMKHEILALPLRWFALYWTSLTQLVSYSILYT